MGVSKLILVEDFNQLFTAHFARVTTDGTKHTKQFSAFAVFGGSDFVEVGEGPVEFVAVNVVDFEAFGSRTDESLPDEMMAETSTELAHFWVRATAFMVLLTRIKSWLEFTSLSTKELALVGTEKDFSADEFRRDLFDNWYVHITTLRRDDLSPKGGAKVEVLVDLSDSKF